MDRPPGNLCEQADSVCGTRPCRAGYRGTIARAARGERAGEWTGRWHQYTSDAISILDALSVLWLHVSLAVAERSARSCTPLQS